MIIRNLIIVLIVIGITSCESKVKNNSSIDTNMSIKIVGAMKNVMWKGELGSSINIDTISNKNGLYGLGPESYLTGELLINNGESYVSKVVSDSTMTVEKTFNVSTPFFVYSNVNEWDIIELPLNIKTIKDLEQFITEKAMNKKHPFTFKLSGQISNAIIHIQNLPKGTSVSSPKEAHQGQINYTLNDEDCDIIGFYSTEHKGIFTHHDSFLHMHLITKDESKMGHLDALEIKKMKLFLSK